MYRFDLCMSCIGVVKCEFFYIIVLFSCMFLYINFLHFFFVLLLEVLDQECLQKGGLLGLMFLAIFCVTNAIHTYCFY